MDGESHVVHAEEEALGTRLEVNALTVLLSKEADPSRLVATSPGKLVRCDPLQRGTDFTDRGTGRRCMG